MCISQLLRHATPAVEPCSTLYACIFAAAAAMHPTPCALHLSPMLLLLLLPLQTTPLLLLLLALCVRAQPHDNCCCCSPVEAPTTAAAAVHRGSNPLLLLPTTPQPTAAAADHGSNPPPLLLLTTPKPTATAAAHQGASHKLVEHRGHLEAHAQHAALALQAHILGPLHKAAQVTLRGRLAAQT